MDIGKRLHYLFHHLITYRIRDDAESDNWTILTLFDPIPKSALVDGRDATMISSIVTAMRAPTMPSRDFPSRV